MKLDKIKSQQKKIDVLLKSVKKGGGSFSVLEKDLLLSYLRKMYETVIQYETTEENHPIIAALRKDAVSDPQEESKIEKIEKEPEIQAKQETEDILEEQNDAEEEVNNQEEVMPSSSLHIPEEVHELFYHKEAVELSERLSESPIKDLGKAMGINEKIFTIKELFGGKQEIYNDTINSLNSFHDFEEAKDYLIKNIAVVFEWGSENKKKKANNFIKLVKRRYK